MFHLKEGQGGFIPPWSIMGMTKMASSPPCPTLRRTKVASSPYVPSWDDQGGFIPPRPTSRRTKMASSHHIPPQERPEQLHLSHVPPQGGPIWLHPPNSHHEDDQDGFISPSTTSRKTNMASFPPCPIMGMTKTASSHVSAQGEPRWLHLPTYHLKKHQHGFIPHVPSQG